MANASGNVLHDVPADLAEERFEDLVVTAGARFERIVSTGQATPPGEWYDQDGDEFVLLVAGAAGLRFEDTPGVRRLEPGDWHWIAARRRHRVEWTSAQPPTVWLAVHLGRQSG